MLDLAQRTGGPDDRTAADRLQRRCAEKGRSLTRLILTFSPSHSPPRVCVRMYVFTPHPTPSTYPLPRLLHDDMKESGLLPVLCRVMRDFNPKKQPRSHAADVLQVGVEWSLCVALI